MRATRILSLQHSSRATLDQSRANATTRFARSEIVFGDSFKSERKGVTPLYGSRCLRQLIEREIFRNTISKDTRQMNHNQAFGKALREQRTIRKLSQDTLAFEAGLDRTYISLLELGKQSPTLDTIFTLCRALQIPVATIAQRTEDIVAAANE